jgi:hypothetical protein
MAQEPSFSPLVMAISIAISILVALILISVFF